MNDFDTRGFIPVDHVFDHGFQVQGSTMLVPKLLQSYITGAKVYGAYGHPWELGFGLTLFPFRTKEMRMNFQALNEHRRPTGNNALPYQVGDNGWIYTVTWVSGSEDNRQGAMPEGVGENALQIQRQNWLLAGKKVFHPRKKAVILSAKPV